jgi:hypothetical protein
MGADARRGVAVEDDVSNAIELVVIMIAPTLTVGMIFWVPQLMRRARLLHQQMTAADEPRTTGPPLERISADLRRLTAEHAAVRSSASVAVRAHRLVAIEGALTDRALEAARALDVPAPRTSGRDPLPVQELRTLLLALVDAGLVLPDADRFNG